MAKSPFAKRDEQYDLSRRALIKWTVAAGAALGVSRSKVFDILMGTKTDGMAHALTVNATHRSIHIVAGNGGFAWFQLLWPHPEIAGANNPNFAYHTTGQGALMQGTDRPLWVGPDTPWANLAPARQMTAFVAGRNETHTNQPQTAGTLNGASIFAIATALQASTPTVLPVIQIGDLALGTAAGSSPPTAVNSGAGIVNLFNSAASRAGGLLSQLNDAQLYKAQYDAFAQLNRAAGRATQRSSYQTASGAAKFLGTNLASQLAITDQDRAMYGLNGNTRGNVAAIGEALIVSVKAFKLGLTNSVMIPAMRDDPHGAFGAQGNSPTPQGDTAVVPPQLKAVFDGFMMHMTASIDEVSGKSLADDTVLTICGDTTKDPRERNGWPDGTANNSSLIYLWSQGHIHTGFHGNYGANGQVQGIQANGALGAYNVNDTAKLANLAIAHSIAKRDQRAYGQFNTDNTSMQFARALDA